MAAASFTAAKFLAPAVAARSGGDRPAPFLASSSMRPLRRTRPAQRLLAVSSDVLAGKKAAAAADAQPVRHLTLVFSLPLDEAILLDAARV
jgi:hypothetical protein